MKTVIVAAAFISLLVAGPASAQAVGSVPSARWVPAAPTPAAYALRDTTVDVGASLTGPRSWRLGEFTLLQREDSDIALRFTLTSVPPPAIPAAPPRGQALGTVRLDVIVLTRR